MKKTINVKMWIRRVFIFLFMIISQKSFSQNAVHTLQITNVMREYDYAKDVNIINDKIDHYIGCTVENQDYINITKMRLNSTSPYVLWSVKYYPSSDDPLRLFKMIDFSIDYIAVLGKSNDKIIYMLINKANGSIARSYEYITTHVYPAPYDFVSFNGLSGLDLERCMYKYEYEDETRPVKSNNNQLTSAPANNIVITGSVHYSDKIVLNEIKNSFAFKINALSGAIVWSKMYTSGLFPVFADPSLLIDSLDYDSFNDVQEDPNNGNLYLTGTSNTLVQHPIIQNLYDNRLSSSIAAIDGRNGNLIYNLNEMQYIGVQSIVDNTDGNVITIYNDYMDYESIYVTERDAATGSLIMAKKYSTYLWDNQYLRGFDPYTITQDQEYFYIAGYYTDINDYDNSTVYPVGTLYYLKLDKSNLSVVESIARPMQGNNYIKDENDPIPDIYHRQIGIGNIFYYPNISNLMEGFLYSLGLSTPASVTFIETQRLLSGFTPQRYNDCFVDLIINEEPWEPVTTDELVQDRLNLVYNQASIFEAEYPIDYVISCKEPDVEEESKPQFIFPNPADDVFNINEKEISEVLVYNSTGQLMLQRMISTDETNKKFDVSEFSPGIYFVQLYYKDGKVERHILKKQ